MMRINQKGFSLIEVIIIVVILGFLAAVVIASSEVARQKARDEARLGDLRTLQIGLALYHDVNRGYPPGNEISALNILVDQKYIPSIPNDPSGGNYEYMVTGPRYCLGVTLERTPPEGSANCASAFSGSTANYKVQR